MIVLDKTKIIPTAVTEGELPPATPPPPEGDTPSQRTIQDDPEE